MDIAKASRKIESLRELLVELLALNPARLFQWRPT